MAVTQQHQPQPQHAPPASTSTAAAEAAGTSKRHRRPSVRLGEIGDQPAASLTKSGRSRSSSSASRMRNLANLGTLDEESDEIENQDDLAIGNWKSTKGSKSKRVRTNWAPKFEDPTEEDHNQNHNNSNNVNDDDDVDDDEDGRGLGIEEEGGEDMDLNARVRVRVPPRGDGVRVWLNGLGLGRYWPVFEVHEVDEEVLPLLRLEDLKDMGINAVGSRRKMFCAIQKLNKVFS